MPQAELEVSEAVGSTSRWPPALGGPAASRWQRAASAAAPRRFPAPREREEREKESRFTGSPFACTSIITTTTLYSTPLTPATV
eukprot:scaffold15935_cov39-Tisochrysis_lutea.AAC.2